MSLKDIAMQLVLRGMPLEEILKKYEFKKNKGPEDIRDAVKRGMKNGMGKVEHEIEMVEINLQKVLTKKK